MSDSDFTRAADVGSGTNPSPAPRFGRHVHALLGLPFDAIGLDDTVEVLRAAAFSNTRCVVSTPNLNFVVAARTDPAFRDSVLRSDLCLADGAPIVWMAKRQGMPIRERVAGADVFDALRRHGGPPLSVFFFGGPPGVAAQASQVLNASTGGLRCVGVDAAGFGSLDAMSTPETIARINASGAHFVIVSLGAKKGQAWIERNAGALQAPLLCHLGAVVNFVAGSVRRAPRWMQLAGLEWMWRIKEEPGLWRRYGSDGLAFLRLAASSRRRVPGSSPAMIGEAPMHMDIRIGRDDEKGASADVVYIALGGACVAEASHPLREAFADAERHRCRIVLSLGDVTCVDSAFLGLLLLARGSRGARGLHLRHVPASVRSAIERAGVAYLLDDA